MKVRFISISIFEHQTLCTLLRLFTMSDHHLSEDMKTHVFGIVICNEFAFVKMVFQTIYAYRSYGPVYPCYQYECVTL